MNRTDDAIRRALAAEEPQRPDDPPMLEQIIDSFRGRNRWLVSYIWLYTFAFAALTLYAVYRFANAAEVTETVSWGVGILFFALNIAMAKIWYWMELNKNVLTRELKRMELQLAELAREVSEQRRA